RSEGRPATALRFRRRAALAAFHAERRPHLAHGDRARLGPRDRGVEVRRRLGHRRRPAAEEAGEEAPDDADEPAPGAADDRQDGRPPRRQGVPGRLVARGAPWHAGRPRRVPGHAAQGAAPDLHEPTPLAHDRRPRQRGRQAERPDAGAAQARPGRPRTHPHGLAAGQLRPRAAVVLTGSELVRGQRTDRNGPFLARELVRLGFEPARLIIVGDDADELDAAFHEGLRYELCITSGGLGPTHDDRTVELLAHVTGRKLLVDEALRTEIEGVSRRISERFKRPYADFQPGIVKQATLPEGALSLGRAGTAPGALIESENRIAIALPGPPAELKRLWRNALDSEPMRRLLARVPPAHERVVRVYGATESAVARAFEEAGGEGEGLVATICAHDFEVRVDLVAEPGAEERAAEVETALVESLARFVFARDG